MAVLIELSAGGYDQFLDAVGEKSFAYRILKNVVTGGDDAAFKDHEVAIHCDYKEARRLLARAARVYPEAAEDIMASAHLWER